MQGFGNVYFDQYDGRTGFVYRNLEGAVEHAALFLFLASPGSCRNGSWCARESQAFWDTALPIPKFSRDQRVASLMIREVEQGDIPQRLQALPPLGFRDLELDVPFLLDQIEVDGSPARKAFFGLCKDLASRLKNAKAQLLANQSPRSKTFFFGAAAQSLVGEADYLRNNVESLGHRVILVTPGLDSEEDFQRRTRDAVGKADLSLHLLGTPNLYQPARDQCAEALRSGRKAYIWQRRGLEYDNDHSTFIESVRSAYSSRGTVEFPVGEAISYLDPNLQFDIEAADRRELAEAPQAPKVASTETSPVRQVLLEYDARDLRSVNEIIVPRLLSKGLKILFPPAKAATNDDDPYKNADGILVFFGVVNELWSFRRCSGINDRVGETIAQRNPLIFLAPPSDRPKEKSSFTFRPFQVLQHGSTAWEQKLDAWADRVATT